MKTAISIFSILGPKVNEVTEEGRGGEQNSLPKVTTQDEATIRSRCREIGPVNVAKFGASTAE